MPDEVRGNQIPGAWIDLESGIVRVADADLQGAIVSGGPEADLAERAVFHGTRRRGTATARVDPGAAHLQLTVVGLGDRAHRGEAIDAHPQIDLGHRKPGL